MILSRNKKIAFFIHCVVTILSFQLNELSAQCDFRRGQIISFDVTDVNNEAGYSDIYLLLDMDGIIVDISENTVFVGQATGNYRIASLNYMDDSVVNGIAIGRNEANISGTCFNISYSLPLSVCLESSCEFCNGDPVSFLSNNGNMDSDYELLYLLVNTQGTIIDITADPSFSTVVMGDYSVVSLSYISDASTSGILVGGSIQSIMSDCIDFGNSIAFQVCENYSINVPSTIQKCSDEVIVLTAGTNGDPDDLVWTDGINTYLGNGIEVLPTVNTQYAVSLNGDNCSESQTINVLITDPVITVASDNLTLCIGEQANIEVNQIGLTYLWCNDETTRSITVAPMNTTTYSVTATDNNGCTSSQEITIDVNFQDCELPCAAFTHEEIVLQVAGVNTNVDYETKYVLASIDGTILNIIDNPNFGQLPEGSYIIISLNYNLVTGVTGLTLGNQVSQITGECLDISVPLIFDVCIKNTTCEEVENNNENICYILTNNPSDLLAALDCDGDGDTNIEECDNGTNPIDPCDSSNETEEDVCSFIADNSTSELSNSDCDGDGVINHTECMDGTDPTDPCDYDPSHITLTVTADQSGCVQEGLFGFVWKDMDGDGLQGSLELGIPNVRVEILDCNGVLQYTTFTNNEGFYVVDDLIFGYYIINFDISVIGSNCEFTTPNAGEEAIDSDVNLNGSTNCIYIGNVLGGTQIDAGLIELSSIGDRVWHDANGDGILNSSEPGIAGVVINLYNVNGDLMETVMTNADGYYLFDNLYPDTYFVEFIDPDGFESTFSEQGNDDSIDSDITNEIIIQDGGSTTGLYILGPGDNNLTVDAGYYMCVPIGETVWYDVNTNDIEESTENGINGMLVTLWRQSNGVWEEWDEMYTGHKPGTPSDDGYYKFCAAPGTYYLEFKLPPIGLVQAQPNVGGDLRDSDVTNGNGLGTTNSFTVLSGEELCTIGAGYYPMAEVGNYVWRDANYNGVQEANELPLEGVKVEVYDLDNNKVSEAVTDENGEYQVDYLQQTSYYLRFTPPANYTVTAANAGDDEKDSDVTHAYGANTTNAYTLNSGDKVTSVDAGMALGVLPVEWLYVKATHRGDYNLVEWSTATEINSDYFEIERSVGNSSSFETIARLDAQGIITSITEYDIKDSNITQANIYYYRIKQIDIDGLVDYSDVVFVVVDKVESAINIYPNPAINTALIQLNGDVTEATANVYSKQGQLIRSDLILQEISSGNYELTLDITTLSPGVYTVQINSPQSTWIEKFIVVK